MAGSTDEQMWESLAVGVRCAYRTGVRRRLRPLYLALVLVLIASPVALSTLAEANPPDPSWIAGVWDGGDHDDVIVFLTNATALRDPEPRMLGPDWSLDERIVSPPRLFPHHDSPLPFHLRAPPRG